MSKRKPVKVRSAIAQQAWNAPARTYNTDPRRAPRSTTRRRALKDQAG